MNILALAHILLIGRIIAVIFTLLVIKKQAGLRKLYVRPGLDSIRKALMGLSIVAFLTNLIPITIDILTLSSGLTRSTNHVNIVGVVYALNACLSTIILSIFIWLLYIQAAKTIILVDKDLAAALEIK